MARNEESQRKLHDGASSPAAGAPEIMKAEIVGLARGLGAPAPDLQQLEEYLDIASIEEAQQIKADLQMRLQAQVGTKPVSTKSLPPETLIASVEVTVLLKDGTTGHLKAGAPLDDVQPKALAAMKAAGLCTTAGVGIPHEPVVERIVGKPFVE